MIRMIYNGTSLLFQWLRLQVGVQSLVGELRLRFQVGVQSLIGELRSHRLHGMAKATKTGASLVAQW